MQKPEISGSTIQPGQGASPKIQHGIITNKYMAVMAKAQELLHSSNTEHTIYDDLNCGKLTRFIRYIRNGSAYLVLYFSYIECVMN